MPRHRLSEEQWECIADAFPKPASRGRPPLDAREVLDAILWILRSGALWRDLPETFGPWQSFYHHFNKWNGDGTLDEVLGRLQAAYIDADVLDGILWCVDGTTIRAARCAAGGGKKGIHRNLTTTH